jgi:hypothetical protein
MARVKLILVKPPVDRDLTPEEIAALFTRLTGQPTTAQDLEAIRAELDRDENEED